MLGQAVTFGIRADLTSCPVVLTRSLGSLRGVDCKIPHRQVRDVLLALLVVLVLTCCTRFGASGLEVSSRHQEQNREGGKAQSGQYTACWAGLLQYIYFNRFYSNLELSLSRHWTVTVSFLKCYCLDIELLLSHFWTVTVSFFWTVTVSFLKCYCLIFWTVTVSMLNCYYLIFELLLSRYWTITILFFWTVTVSFF
jgi:hypothetical protein